MRLICASTCRDFDSIVKQLVMPEAMGVVMGYIKRCSFLFLGARVWQFVSVCCVCVVSIYRYSIVFDNSNMT